MALQSNERLTTITAPTLGETVLSNFDWQIQRFAQGRFVNDGNISVGGDNFNLLVEFRDNPNLFPESGLPYIGCYLLITNYEGDLVFTFEEVTDDGLRLRYYENRAAGTMEYSIDGVVIDPNEQASIVDTVWSGIESRINSVKYEN